MLVLLKITIVSLEGQGMYYEPNRKLNSIFILLITSTEMSRIIALSK